MPCSCFARRYGERPAAVRVIHAAAPRSEIFHDPYENAPARGGSVFCLSFARRARGPLFVEY
ncbi:hypothetical protein B5F39_05120 [Cloacibacillus sp. An23]|nr:hypothetical protein B5F39_05120 [Cloacibacillus sp. An23]